MLKFKQFNDESAKCLNKLGDSANFFNSVLLPDSVKDGRWGGNQSVCEKIYYCRVQDFPFAWVVCEGQDSGDRSCTVYSVH
jgi:hypothetical protein